MLYLIYPKIFKNYEDSQNMYNFLKNHNFFSKFQQIYSRNIFSVLPTFPSISSKFLYIFIFSTLQQNFLKNNVGFTENLPVFY